MTSNGSIAKVAQTKETAYLREYIWRSSMAASEVQLRHYNPNAFCLSTPFDSQRALDTGPPGPGCRLAAAP